MSRLLPLWLVAAIAGGSAQQPVFRATVEVVRIDVSVMRKGRPVTGLSSRDFVVTDSGVAQEVDSVVVDQLPLEVTLVFDVSASVSGVRLASLKNAARELTTRLRPADQAALITFTNGVHLAVAMTDDLGLMRRALEELTASGATALRDAVHVATMLQAPASRSLMLVFTDGRDTASWLTEADVLDSVRRAGGVIHIVGSASDPFSGRLADVSGGRVWSASSDRQLSELFTQALDEMRARYLLSYSPRGVDRPGWHEVEVRLRGLRADVTARPGYFVP